MTDAELVREVLWGRAECYGDLVDRHQAAVARLCRGTVGPGPDGDEIAHDALVDGYLKLAQLRDADRFGAWVRTIALNRCRRWLQTRARLAPLDEAGNAPEPDGEAARARGVSHAMFALAPAQRLVLILHYWERLPYAAIADFLGVPIGTVMSRMSRAREGLRRVIEMEADDMATAPVPDLRAEVDAEIRVLLALVGKDHASRAKLAALLRQSPGRVQELVETCDDGTARDVALLLPRLGPDVMDRLLGWASGGQGSLRDGALRVARAAAGVPAQVAERAATSRIASRCLYALVDRLPGAAESPFAAAAVLVDMLGHAGKDERSAALLASAASACGDAGLEAAVARLAALRDAAAVFRAGDAVHVACRYGTRFAQIVVPSLEGAGPITPGAAVGCAEALGRALRLWADLGAPADDALRADRRRRLKWAAPLSRDRDPAVLERLAAALEARVTVGDADTRRRAIRALGMLPCAPGLDTLMDAARDADERTAVTALRALGDRADGRAGDLLADLAEHGPAPIRTAAVQALGALVDASRLPLLERVARADDRELGRAASTAVARLRHEAGQAAPSGADGAFRMADVVRDGATPAAFVSLETAMACLPEDGAYDEPEVTRLIAAGSWDYSSVRRYLVEEGILARAGGVYRLTDFGRTAWRVERRIAAA